MHKRWLPTPTHQHGIFPCSLRSFSGERSARPGRRDDARTVRVVLSAQIASGTLGVPSDQSTPRRVMVGTDRSETAEQAVRWAAGFAERFDAELHVVQVVIPRAGEVDLGSMTGELTTHAR